ncbi:hypothetical protein YK56LOC_37930 [Caballeronia sp. HLA56]
MDDFHENREAGPNSGGSFARRLPARLLELLAVLVADVASDVEVVARELGLRDEMRERLRRALDRVGCAQAVLGAMREVGLRQSAPAGQCAQLPRSGQLKQAGSSKQSGQLKESGRLTEEMSAEGSYRGGGGDTGGSDDYRGDEALDAVERVRGAVELLAEGWPQDYPEGAVEWLILDAMEGAAG